MVTSPANAWRAITLPIAVSVCMVFLFVSLFAAALHHPQPHHLKVGVVAPAAAVDRIIAGAELQAPGTFAFATYPDEEAAKAAVLDRELAGALVVGPGQSRILVASAGGEPGAKAISAAFTAMAQTMGRPAAVEDLLTLPESDTRGLVPFFLILGVSVSAFIFQLLLNGRSGPLRRWGTIVPLVAFAVLDGLLAALAVGIVLGFDSGYWSLMGVCALLALAVASATAASRSLFGRAGIGVAALILILLGNASSGSVVGSAFLPQPFRWLSPVLPAGSGLEAARSVMYFGGAGAGWRVGTLAIWVAGSLAVIALMGLVRARSGRSGPRGSAMAAA
jgi:hypothetical protein